MEDDEGVQVASSFALLGHMIEPVRSGQSALDAFRLELQISSLLNTYHLLTTHIHSGRRILTPCQSAI